MRLEFIGTGNALDTMMSNCSFFVRGSKNLLVDCGYDIPRRLFEHPDAITQIDGIYLTHFHGDHSFGFPFLILALEKQGRRDALQIIGQPGTKEFLLGLLRMAYPSVIDRLSFELEFIESINPLRFGGMQLEFAKTAHGRSNYAVKISDNDAVIGISGDGALSDESRDLFTDCQLLVHDACTLEEPYETHESARNVVEYCAKSCPTLRALACVHLLESERAERKVDYMALAANLHFSVMVPEPGDSWAVG